jgi:hypothetical protein
LEQGAADLDFTLGSPPSKGQGWVRNLSLQSPLVTVTPIAIGSSASFGNVFMDAEHLAR